MMIVLRQAQFCVIYVLFTVDSFFVSLPFCILPSFVVHLAFGTCPALTMTKKALGGEAQVSLTQEQEGKKADEEKRRMVLMKMKMKMKMLMAMMEIT